MKWPEGFRESGAGAYCASEFIYIFAFTTRLAWEYKRASLVSSMGFEDRTGGSIERDLLGDYPLRVPDMDESPLEVAIIPSELEKLRFSHARGKHHFHHRPRLGVIVFSNHLEQSLQLGGSQVFSDPIIKFRHFDLKRQPTGQSPFLAEIDNPFQQAQYMAYRLGFQLPGQIRLELVNLQGVNLVGFQVSESLLQVILESIGIGQQGFPWRPLLVIGIPYAIPAHSIEELSSGSGGMWNKPGPTAIVAKVSCRPVTWGSL